MENTHIFISYRRDDARGASGRVWDWLRIGFGRERIFRDVGSIGAGKWRDKIDAALACSRACVAVIGRRWANETNLPRLLEPNDMVRQELVTALARGERGELTMVPLLVEEAKLGDILIRKLPEPLKPLLEEWNVLALTESGWDEDTRRLIKVIAEATGLPVRQDLEEWMSLMMGAERGLAASEIDRQLTSMARSGGRDSLEALLRKVAESSPEGRPGLKAAFEALSMGNTLVAEEAFEREVEAGERLIAAANELIAAERSKQADAAYHVASLALIRGDLSKSLRFQRKALEYDPDHIMARLQMGYALLSMGSRREAEAHFRDLLIRANSLADDNIRAMALIGIGDVRMAQGDGPDALNAFRAGIDIRKDLISRDPTNSDWLRDLALGHERVGNVMMVQGNASGAMKAYRTSLEIIEALSKREPANTQWQSDLSVIYNNVGNLLMSQGDLSGALNSYRAGLKLAIALAQYDPDNLLWQREKSVRYVNIGNVLKAQRDSTEALTNYRAGLEIREALTRKDPSNMGWQVDLAISYARIGSLAEVLGMEARRDYLVRGREILTTLKSTGKLPKNKDCINWFDDQLRKIENE